MVAGFRTRSVHSGAMTASTTPPSRRAPRPSVLVAGGGVAALETVLALHALAGDVISITVLCPESEMLYRPVTTAEAFQRGEARSFDIDAILTEHRARHVRDTLAAVDADRRLVLTGAGDELSFDHLVIATGARSRSPLPGALAFGGRDDVTAMRELLADLVDGGCASVAFTVTSPHGWTLPLYELALMTAAHVREQGSDARITLVTPEPAPLAIFGPAAAEALQPMFGALGVGVRCLSRPAAVARGELLLAGGGGIIAERVVCLREAVGPAIDGVPGDATGFIPVDAHGRVRGTPGVYAAGDVTALALKQGGLAAQEADAVAETIAAAVGVAIDPTPFRPILRGLLITSGAPVYLRCEPHRMERRSSVAIDEQRPARVVRNPASVASDQSLWWPPAKVAARYLSAYLATARPLALTAAGLADRVPTPGPAPDPDESADALELALLLADGDADWGDYRAALRALDAAEAIRGVLPLAYEHRRRLWQSELRQAG